jgi:hypothetical protein
MFCNRVSSDAFAETTEIDCIMQGGGLSGSSAFGLPSPIQMTTLIYVKTIPMRFLSACCSGGPSDWE